MNALGRPLGFEQRGSVKVLVLVRWVLLAALLAVIDYPLRSDTRAAAVIGGFGLVALGANLALQVAILRRYRHHGGDRGCGRLSTTTLTCSTTPP